MHTKWAFTPASFSSVFLFLFLFRVDVSFGQAWIQQSRTKVDQTSGLKPPFKKLHFQSLWSGLFVARTWADIDLTKLHILKKNSSWFSPIMCSFPKVVGTNDAKDDGQDYSQPTQCLSCLYSSKDNTLIKLFPLLMKMNMLLLFLFACCSVYGKNFPACLLLLCTTAVILLLMCILIWTLSNFAY